MSNVNTNYSGFIDPLSFKPIANGAVYVGEYGVLPNPANPLTWKACVFVNSDGSTVSASQPIATNAAGWAVDGSGNIKILQTDGNYSLLVLDSFGATKYSNPSVVDPVGSVVSLANGALQRSGGTMTGALNEAAGASIIAGATTDIGSATGNAPTVTGSATITSLGTAPSGSERVVTFAGSCILTHNASTLALPLGQNFVTQAGDVLTFRATSTGWTLTDCNRFNGFNALGSSYQVQRIDAAVAANALTLVAKPNVLQFRSATLGSGVVDTLAWPADLSLVVPSGATLGTVNSQQSRLVLLVMNNGGTPELAVINAIGSSLPSEDQLISTTAIGISSTSANVIYSANARSNLPFRVLGFVESTQSTAGTWVTAPSKIQGESNHSKAYNERLILTSTLATTSGTFADVSGIPVGTKRVTVLFNGVATSGASNILVQIGTNSGVQNTGYSSTYGYLSATPAVTTTTAGFGVTFGIGAGVLVRGKVSIELQDASSGFWVPSSNIHVSSAALVTTSSGGKSLSGTLDRVRVTTVNGTDTFTAGSISLLIEV